MKGLRVFIGAVMVLAFVVSLVLLILSDPNWRWCSGIIALCFGVAALGKAVHLRLNTLRGRFHLILGTGAVAFTAAITVGLTSTTPDPIFILHYLARLVFIISVGLMFAGLMKQGYSLSFLEWIQVLLVFAILTGVGLWLFYSLYAGATVLMSVLVYLSLFLLFETLAVVRVYLGSDLGWRWTAGALSVFFVTLGDMAMAYSATSGLAAWEIVQYLSWSIMASIMCIISLMWD